jgi:hypothetical protein
MRRPYLELLLVFAVVCASAYQRAAGADATKPGR